MTGFLTAKPFCNLETPGCSGLITGLLVFIQDENRVLNGKTQLSGNNCLKHELSTFNLKVKI